MGKAGKGKLGVYLQYVDIVRECEIVRDLSPRLL